MAESGLSIGFGDLLSAVGQFVGYGSTVANFSVSQLAEIDRVVQSGIRRVYYPPAVNEITLSYEWSWLRPTEELAITSGTADYDLPDNFGRLIGAIHYPAAEYRLSISIVSIGKLLAMRAGSALTGAPTMAAIRYKSSTGTTGQRQEILFFPEPDDGWTMLYEYEAYQGALSDTYPYPLGGMQLAELYIESCLAVAEERVNDETGRHQQQYQTLLLDAIARDRKHGARTYGQMGHVELPDGLEFRRGYGSSVYDITYKGDPI